MTTKFEVWSTHVGADKDAPATDLLEVTRTDRKVAEEDRSLVAEVLHRKAWIVEVQS